MSRADAKARARRIERLVAKAPSRVTDLDCPYDPNDANAVAAFWKEAAVVEGGGITAVRASLAERRKQGQRARRTC